MGATSTSRRSGATARALANRLEDVFHAHEPTLAASLGEARSRSMAVNDEATLSVMMGSLASAIRAARLSIFRPNARYNHFDLPTTLLQIMNSPMDLLIHYEICSQLWSSVLLELPLPLSV